MNRIIGKLLSKGFYELQQGEYTESISHKLHSLGYRVVTVVTLKSSMIYLV